MPCNQFLGQEPGTAEEIQTFCSTTYGVTFPLTEKVDVNGDDRHPLYAELTAVADAAGDAGDIQWNFEKFLVAPGGAVDRPVPSDGRARGRRGRRGHRGGARLSRGGRPGAPSTALPGRADTLGGDSWRPTGRPAAPKASLPPCRHPPSVGSASSPRLFEARHTMTTFSDLGVSPDFSSALAAKGIDAPFPIQELTIPDALAGRDVCGKAKTGSGKTLAFGLPVLERVKAPSPGGRGRSILVPTRELAVQVCDELVAARIEARDVTVSAVYGGANMETQIKKLVKGVEIVVATPGRMIDLIDRKEVFLDDVGQVVLDEADRMADMGFLPQVEWILRHIPGQHQTLLFSATLDGVVDTLIKRYQTDPGDARGGVVAGHGRGDAPPLPPRPRDGQGQGGGRHRPGLAPHDRVRAHQARRRPCRLRPAPRGRRGRRPSTATCARAIARRRWPTSPPASCRCWWPPTSPLAASTSTMSTW